jgi:HPr kinase/phosphorylase
MSELLVHGTCIALCAKAAVLRSPSGSGKSDLALRFLFLPPDQLGGRPALVADDQVILRKTKGRIIASCPPSIAGKIEVRGVGIVPIASLEAMAELGLVVDLDSSGKLPRAPMADEWEYILGLPIRRIVLDPLEASAPIKLALAMQNFFGKTRD